MNVVNSFENPVINAHVLKDNVQDNEKIIEYKKLALNSITTSYLKQNRGADVSKNKFIKLFPDINLDDELML